MFTVKSFFHILGASYVSVKELFLITTVRERVHVYC